MRTFPLLIHPVLLHTEKSLLVREMRSNRGWLQYALSPKIRQLFPCVLLWTLAMGPAAMAKSRSALGGLLQVTLAVWSHLQSAAAPCGVGVRNMGSTPEVSVPA